MRVDHIVSGFGDLPLSPASGAARIKHGRNEGGNTFDSMPHLEKFGVNTLPYWPANSRDVRKHDTPESREEALKYRALDWMDLNTGRYRADEELWRRFMSMSLGRLTACPIGLGWWGHMVTALTPRYYNGEWWVPIWNSHGSRFGRNGIVWLHKKLAMMFDCAALLSSSCVEGTK
jgi:hypothetical protein